MDRADSVLGSDDATDRADSVIEGNDETDVTSVTGGDEIEFPPQAQLRDLVVILGDLPKHDSCEVTTQPVRDHDNMEDGFGPFRLSHLWDISQKPSMARQVINMWIIPKQFQRSKVAMQSYYPYLHDPVIIQDLKDIFSSFRRYDGIQNIYLFSFFQPMLSVLASCGYDRPLVTLCMDTIDARNHPDQDDCLTLTPAEIRLIRGFTLGASFYRYNRTPSRVELVRDVFYSEERLPDHLALHPEWTELSTITKNALQHTSEVEDIWAAGYGRGFRDCDKRDPHNVDLFPIIAAREYRNLRRLKLADLYVDCPKFIALQSPLLEECHLYRIRLMAGSWQSVFNKLSQLSHLRYLCLSMLEERPGYAIDIVHEPAKEKNCEASLKDPSQVTTALSKLQEGYRAYRWPEHSPGPAEKKTKKKIWKEYAWDTIELKGFPRDDDVDYCTTYTQMIELGCREPCEGAPGFWARPPYGIRMRQPPPRVYELPAEDTYIPDYTSDSVR